MRNLGWAMIGLLALLLATMPAPSFATDDEHVQKDEHAAEASEHGAHGEGGHGTRDFKNEVALFLGATDEHGHGTEPTWGVDYKRRVAERWAVGGLFDYAGGELRNSVLAVPVVFWPGLGNLQLLAAPGVEFHDGRGNGDSHKSDEGHGADEDATYFLFRLGAGYDFHLPKGFGIVPTINIDFVNSEEVWVWGVALTYAF